MAQQPFAFSDTATFAQNISDFIAELARLDVHCGPVLSVAILQAQDLSADKTALLAKMLDAIVEADKIPSSPASPTLATPVVVAPLTVQAVGPSQVRWFLEELTIEGFRGINNEGSPLSLSFKSDCVSSISAPNGVGKSSIYDALSYALAGKLPKLERLQQSERAQDYYLNRFHPQNTGTITLTVRPDDGGKPVTITVTRSAAGVRKVVGPSGIDAVALLSDLNREFVLLDGQTFHSFIDDKALERGRAFSGLLGLSRYSILRQQLQSLANTRAFNAHFDVAGHSATKAAADRRAASARNAIRDDYALLVKEAISQDQADEHLQGKCHAALSAIPVLTGVCADRLFSDIDIDACVSAAGAAEVGPNRERLAKVIQDQAKWKVANKDLPGDADATTLVTLAGVWEDALKATSGDLLRQLYRLGERIMLADGWPSPSLCPACERDDGTSVLAEVQSKLTKYNAVEFAASAVRDEWIKKAWGDLSELETLAVQEIEQPLLRILGPSGTSGTLTSEAAARLGAHIATLRERAREQIAAFEEERGRLERELPPSLVAVTATVEAARRLQTNWKLLDEVKGESAAEAARSVHVDRLKSFLDKASSNVFANAESALAAARLQKIEPLTRELFDHIMYSPVVPGLIKPPGSEELGIRLAEFYGLKDLSAQALLSESYRNAFAVSVYLAAASLYGGAPRFVVLDDVTSSLDAGHQLHLVEVIRTRFACPITANGPQVILLSHDTLLEKLFNKYAGSPGWSHQRLEGAAHTAVLLQSGAANKVRDAAIDLLQVGRIDDAAPRIRNYLEFTLHRVIDRCRIPVPIDLAFGDDKRTAGEYLKAINSAVDLQRKAGSLVLNTAQQGALQLHSATIVGNFLSHWSTGQTQAFSGPALLGVMRAIEAFPDCFMYEPTPGAQKRFYSSLSHR